MRSSTFFAAQKDLLLAAEDVDNESMMRAVADLRVARNTIPRSKYVTAVGTSDGAYQQRSGKPGEEFSRYCFAAAVLAETGKVVSYGVACNSCATCTLLDNMLLSNEISKE